VVFDEVVDGRFEFFRRAMNAAPKLTLGKQCEPALHQV
jgi:hypothetical protein